MIVVREVDPHLLHEVRRRVLRDGRSDARVHDDRDGDQHAIHFAAFQDDIVIGSASVYPSESPTTEYVGTTYQLRYLAVDMTLQRSGIGRQLMRAVEDRLGSLGVDILWANGRDSALDFYLQTGWVVLENSAHLSPETQLPHHVIVKQLRDHRTYGIRRATLDDVPALVDLRARMMYAIDLVDDRGTWLQASTDYFVDGLRRKTLLGWVATVERDVVGSAMAELRTTPPSPRKSTGRVAYVHTVATLPSFRRRGISRVLLNELFQDLASHNLDAVELHATDQGFPLYEQLGFSLRGGNEMRRWMR